MGSNEWGDLDALPVAGLQLQGHVLALGREQVHVRGRPLDAGGGFFDRCAQEKQNNSDLS